MHKLAANLRAIELSSLTVHQFESNCPEHQKPEHSRSTLDSNNGFSLFNIDIIGAGGIRSSDALLFYLKNQQIARTTSTIAYDNLALLKQNKSDIDKKRAGNNGDMDGIFGGLVLCCNSHGKSYFREPNLDLSPISRNFLGVPVAGVFCRGEIGRGSSKFIIDEHREQRPPHCSRHASSAIYLVMSYHPVPSTSM
ncbi:hypothetical protein RIF29_10548 [Crotalaria pallida]|uniref:FIST C-domain domain-containing protein n=1 Tax=Crotalaria pallida TaxID=3830 RepID=A0AAN9FW40_CROPI